MTTDPSNGLSADLYIALKRCLQRDAQEIMLHKKGIRDQGISFLQLLKSTYNPQLSTVEQDEKQRQLLSIARKSDQTINPYGARCIQLKELLAEDGIITLPEEMKTIPFGWSW